MNLNYETDLYHEYKNKLENCSDYTSLKNLILEYSPVSPDLMEVKMDNNEDYQKFLEGFKLERQRIFAGEEWHRKYGSILLPHYIFRAQLLADTYQVSCGLAYLRMCAEGYVPGVDCELAKQEIFKSSLNKN